MDLQKKYRKLLKYIGNTGKTAIAFSGGADSNFLLKAALEALGPDRLLALTIDTPYIPGREIKEAENTARKLGIRHIILGSQLPGQIRNNPRDRCYLCKTFLFKKLLETAGQHGFTRLMDGTNSEDKPDHRPGMKALEELGIVSPLRETGFTKQEIRRLSRLEGLDTWDRPPNACLLTRFPYDTAIDESLLRRVEKSENYLYGMGLRSFRVRAHGELARIEVQETDFAEILNSQRVNKIRLQLKRYGFRYVTLDLEGLRSGSFDQ